MLRYIITLLCLSCLTLTAQAEEIKLRKNHPYRYTVVKGDTLWDISGKFLQQPWQWPKVWKMNRSQIKNPHLIYPGDVIVLDTSAGYPQFSLLHETVKLEPGVVVESLDKKAIYTIPPNVIGPFLDQPLLIENGQLDSAPRIVGAQDDRLILSPGTRVYVQNLDKTDKTFFNIYRPGEVLRDPDTDEVLGTEAVYLGDTRITKFGEPASADIVTAEEEIFVKDRLVVANDTFKENFIPHAPETDINAKVIKIYGGLAEAGPNTIVAINKGKLDGLEEGHVLAVNRFGKTIQDPEYTPTEAEKLEAAKPKLKQLNFDIKTAPDGSKIVNFAKEPKKDAAARVLKPGEVKLPDERIGLVMVFRTFDRIAYALIMQVDTPVNINDTITKP